MPNSRGVTLFEVLVAALVVALLALVAIPPIREAQRNLQFDAVASRIRSELHRIRILSIVRNADCRLRVTTPTSYIVECEAPEWVGLGFNEVPRGFEISANNEPEFHPRGNVGPMATIRVLSGGDEKRVIVSRSGRVRIE